MTLYFIHDYLELQVFLTTLSDRGEACIIERSIPIICKAQLLTPPDPVKTQTIARCSTIRRGIKSGIKTMNHRFPVGSNKRCSVGTESIKSRSVTLEIIAIMLESEMYSKFGNWKLRRA